MDPNEASKSFMDFAKETKKKTDECCEKANADVKEALSTILLESSKMKVLLAKLKAEEEEAGA
jgi:hypothetical protein